MEAIQLPAQVASAQTLPALYISLRPKAAQANQPPRLHILNYTDRRVRSARLIRSRSAVRATRYCSPRSYKMKTIPIEFRQLTGADNMVDAEPCLKAVQPSALQYRFEIFARRMKLIMRLAPQAVQREYTNEQILDWAKNGGAKRLLETINQ